MLGGSQKILEYLPLIMFVFCLFFGSFILMDNNPENFVSGHLIIFLGMVCINLFFLAALITRQSRGGKSSLIYPIIGFLVAISTIVYGLFLIIPDIAYYKETGHNICGIGLICLCIAVETMICTKFTIIQENSSKSSSEKNNIKSFSNKSTTILTLIPLIAVFSGWACALYLIYNGGFYDNFIPGHVMAGMSLVCTCILAAAVHSLRQINNNYQRSDFKIWPDLSLIMGLTALIWGLCLLFINQNPATFLPTGFLLIGISFVCFSITSKLFLVSRTWKRSYANTYLVPFIPLLLFLFCIFLSFFLFQASFRDLDIYIPSRVLVGMGAVCFSIFALVSIISQGKSH